MNIGDRIKAVRREAKLTQKELAEKSGIPVVTLQQYERGVRKQPKPEQIEKIADSLGVSSSYLLCQTDDPSPGAILRPEDMDIFCERLGEQLAEADSEDIYACFGTYRPYQEILEQHMPISVSKAAEIAESLGVSLQYMLGRTDNPYPDISEFARLASKDIEAPETIEALRSLRRTHERELLLSSTRITARSQEATNKALQKLNDLVLEICHDDNAVTEPQHLNELQFMPSRIGNIIDFINANRKFLMQNMPGRIPANADEGK